MEEHYLKRELYELVQRDSSIFEFLQRGSLDGIWYWDLENQEHEWMSPRLWEVLGHAPEAMEHRVEEWQDLIFPEDLEIAVDNFNKHCEDPDHSYDQIVRYRHMDGSTGWVRCRGLAIRDENGKPVRMLGAHTDLTQLHRTVERLERRTAELEQANAKLKQALDNIRVLEADLAICSYCRRVRDESEQWSEIEAFVASRTGAEFTHAICPDCMQKEHPEHAEA